MRLIRCPFVPLGVELYLLESQYMWYSISISLSICDTVSVSVSVSVYVWVFPYQISPPLYPTSSSEWELPLLPSGAANRILTRYLSSHWTLSLVKLHRYKTLHDIYCSYPSIVFHPYIIPVLSQSNRPWEFQTRRPRTPERETQRYNLLAAFVPRWREREGGDAKTKRPPKTQGRSSGSAEECFVM